MTDQRQRAKTHVEITPTTQRPSPEQVRTACKRLHRLGTAESEGGWREWLGIDDTEDPTIEFLISTTDSEGLTYYIGAAQRVEHAALERTVRELFPDEYEIHPSEDPFANDELGPVTSGVDYYGHPAEREDWLTQLTTVDSFLNNSTDAGGPRLPLATVAETFADAEQAMIYQVLLSPLPDYSAESAYFQRQCETGRVEPLDPDAPDAGSSSELIDRSLTAEQRERLTELDAKDSRHLFTVNARLVALGDAEQTNNAGDGGGVTDDAATLTSALTACSRTGYQIAGEHVTGDVAQELAEDIRDRRLHPPDYGGISTWLPGTRDRSQGIVADAGEVGCFCLVTGDGLTSAGSRAVGPTPGERTPIERPPETRLEPYHEDGLAIGHPVDEDGNMTDTPVAVPPSLQPLHAAWFGGTGSGKTTALTNAVLDNHGATAGLDILIDPKGDGMPTEYLRAHYAEYGTLENVFYFDCEQVLPAFSFFDIRDELAAGIDRETAVEDRADHYLEILVQIMGRERFENAVRSPDVIRYLVKAAFDPVHGADAFTHRELHGMARRMHERSSAPGVTDPDLERMLSGVVANRPQTFDNIMQGVANRIEKVPVDRRLARMFNHVPIEESDPSFDLEALLDEDAVVIFDTGGLRTRAQRVLALVVLSNLWTALRRRSRRVAQGQRFENGDTPAGDTDGHVGGLPLVNVYIEEAASIAVSDLLGDLLAKARGFGCAVTLAMQFPGQLREEDPAAYEELLNNVSTVITGKIPLEERFARRLATAEMNATEVGNRLRALQRGRWLASLPAHFGEPEPRPFQVESLPLPEGHPDREQWPAASAAGFETARVGMEARTRTEAGLTLRQASTPSDGPADDDRTAGDDEPGTEQPDDATADRLNRVDSALPHTLRLPESVTYDSERHELRCSECQNRYAPTSDGMERVLGCCGDRSEIDHADVPICEIGLTLDGEERAATEWTDSQLLFLQVVHNAQQLRYEPPGYDIMSESMLRLTEYIDIDRDAIAPLIEAELLRHDTDHPHRLYSVTADGRAVINETAREGVDWGHNRGDLGESSEHVFMVQLGRRYLEAEYRDDPESAVQTVECYYELTGEESPSKSAPESETTHRLDVVGLDPDGEPVVTLEAERLNHDLRRAVPSDYDKMAACDPEASIWLVQTESAAHKILGALNDPLDQPAGEPQGDGERSVDDWDSAPRVEKTYSSTTSSSQFNLDAPGCTEIITATRARKRIEE